MQRRNLLVIIKTIEDLRCELYAVSQGRKLTDHEVIGVSQKLDQYINEYQEINLAESKEQLRQIGAQN